MNSTHGHTNKPHSQTHKENCDMLMGLNQNLTGFISNIYVGDTYASARYFYWRESYGEYGRSWFSKSDSSSVFFVSLSSVTSSSLFRTFSNLSY